MTKITSRQNPRIKQLVKLRQRRERDRQQLFLVEESLVIQRALAADHPLHSAYCCPELARSDGDHQLLAALPAVAGLEVCELTPPVMEKISYRDRPGCVVVVARHVRHTLVELTPNRRSLFVVLESVEKPGNLGAVLRIADAAGADAVLVCGRGTDITNPNTLRASRGALFALPTIEAESGEIGAWLAGHDIDVIATTPDGDRLFTQADLTGAVALLVGSEDRGLSTEWLTAARERVRIPMHGSGDSLNVSTAAALLLYEALRQRAAGTVQPPGQPSSSSSG